MLGCFFGGGGGGHGGLRNFNFNTGTRGAAAAERSGWGRNLHTRTRDKPPLSRQRKTIKLHARAPPHQPSLMGRADDEKKFLRLGGGEAGH